MGMVKNNAYGHGLGPVSKALSKTCDALGVWTLEEARRLWQDFSAGPRLALMAPAFDPPQELALAVKKGAWLSVGSMELARTAAEAARRAKKPAQIFLDLDLGLGRWGSSLAGAVTLAKAILKMKSVQIIGISAHVDYLPGLHKTEAEIKLGRFLETAQNLETLIGRPLIKTCANTAVFLDFPTWRLDMVRIGNLLYGVNPTSTTFGVTNAWTFKAKILNIRAVGRGETLGYASEFLAPKPMKVASVGCGFADGLTMEPAHRFIRLTGSSPYWAKFQGRQLPIVGRVGLGHALLDVSQTPKIKAGDSVELPVRRTAAPAEIPRIY